MRPRSFAEIAPELTGHGLPLGKCEAYNRVYDQFYQPQTGKDRRPPYLLTCRGLRHVRQRVLPAGGRKHASCSVLRWWCWHRINTTQLLLAVLEWRVK